jgi:glutamyl/glutaminyl-tRNA synthetase
MATSAGKTGAPSPEYRGRLAPSPTGYLHLGHARTFYTAYLRARQAHGTLVMRMEDLDTARSKPAYAEAAYDDLRWLGIRWQEGPGHSNRNNKEKNDSPFGPYLQSQRHAIYLDTWRKLLQGGFLFPCRCSRKDLESAIAAPHEAAQDDEPLYPGTCRTNQSSITQTPESINWRFRVPDGEAVEFEDLNLGPQRFVAGQDFGDFLVWRRDGFPSYQLACVADDAAMRITEVVRGADLLKSTARQILLYRALGITPPAWYHCHLVADHNGQRLAKRHDALSIRALRQRGLTPLKVLAANVPMEK